MFIDSSNTVSHLATDNTVVVIGGVVIGSFTTAMTVIVVVVIVSRTCTRCTSAQKRYIYIYICISYNTPSSDMARIYARRPRARSARGRSAYIPAISRRGGVMSDL